MRFLQDEDIRHYIKLGVIGILLFFMAAVGFMFLFRSDYRIELNRQSIEFGDEVRVVDLIKSIGEYKIAESTARSILIIVSIFTPHFTESKARDYSKKP